MIKLKLSFGKNETESDFEIEVDELLKSAVERTTKEVPLGEFKLEDVFNVVVNGHIIDHEFWSKIKLKQTDTILITPKLRDGESGQIFKQVLIIAIAIAAAVIFPPSATISAAGSSLIVAGITLAATLALNALIPPPSIDPSGAIGGLGDSVDSSQMYAITGQSNQMKRLGVVPKVYGTHRIFPTLAATPYTELSVNPANGEIIQYLCGVYDFGLGTPQISEIKIGDTPITSQAFEDFEYRLVDLNKPDIDQDIFDSALNSEFTLYRGSRTTAPLSFDLEDGTEIVQNSANNPESLQQEIILDFVCPRGLFGYSSGGNLGFRTINLEIDFAPVATSDWKSYNDITAVDSFDIVGGAEEVAPLNFPSFQRPLIPLLPGDVGFNTYYLEGSQYTNGNYNGGSNFILNVFLNPSTNKLLVAPAIGDQEWQVGRKVFLHNDIFVGVIQSVAPVMGNVELTLNTNIPGYITAFEWRGANTYVAGMPPVPVYEPAPSNLYGVKSTFGDPSLAVVSGDKSSAVYASFRFRPKAIGQFQVRVRRVGTVGDFVQQKEDGITWGAITTAYNRVPVLTDKRHVFLELKVRATNQLNGNIQNLSAVVSQLLDVYDPDAETWSRQVTDNPAWVFVDLLTNEVNKKAVSKDRLHLGSIVEWADYCAEVPTPPMGQSYLFPRFSCNFILDYEATLQGVLQQVGGSAQASLNIIDGKYGVLVDRLKTTPVQIFTPRNSRDFASTRFYSPQPHGVRVKFIDPQLGWEVSEAIAYDNGYTELNATEIDEMTSFACTNQEQAWRFGRYMIAQNRLRQETMTLIVDFEHLVCTRGDYVQISQDVMQVGGRPARVKAVSGSEITIDDSIDFDIDLSYGYTYRKTDGEVYTSTLTPLTANTFDVDGDIPAVDNLIVIGEVGSIVFDCIVKSISPNDDLSANIALVERANGIFDYESESTLPDYDPQLSNTSRPDFSPPKAVTDLTLSDNTWECAETLSGYNYFAEITWDIPPGSVYENFEVWFDDGRGYKLAANTSAKYFKVNIDQARLNYPHGLKVVAVAASGRKLQLIEMPEVLFTPTVKDDLPSDVTQFGMSITNQTLQLTWASISDCDASKYEIRYSPQTNDIWETSVPLQIVDRNVNSITVQARTGVYFIKAIDFAGNKSESAAQTITTIPDLFDLNIIETFNDAPTFPGEKEQVEDFGAAVILREMTVGTVDTMEFFPEGFYTLFDLLDLGEIYSVRLASYIRADGYRFGELMSEWEMLSEVEHLSTTSGEDWNAIAEYRATNEILAMSDWVHLYEIEHINEGLGSGFTDWRPIPTIGDATGRVFQFRVRLESLTPNVTPRLFDTTLKADMPDRIDSFENLVSSAVAAYTVTYETSFRGPSPSPNVQISIDNGEAGDYWEFDNKNLEGFDIRFYDNNDVQVARQFDVVAKGYGSRHTVTI